MFHTFTFKAAKKQGKMSFVQSIL